MGILVIGATFVDIKGFPQDIYLPQGRNVGDVEYVHGGVARNVVEDIANVELTPTFLGIVDDTPLGTDVLQKLKRHKVNTEYMLTLPDGMGTWLAIFDNNGDIAGSISKRPNLMPLLDLLEEKGDEIFEKCDSIILEIDIDVPIVKKVIELSCKHHKQLFAVVSNMSLAAQRRDFVKYFDCFICNQGEMSIFFAEDYDKCTPEQLLKVLSKKIKAAKIPSMVVTMGDKGAIYANLKQEKGICPAVNIQVKDTTGAGDAFCAGVAIGLTYGKTMDEAIDIGSTLAASVITSRENVCPRYLPEEFGIDPTNIILRKG